MHGEEDLVMEDEEGEEMGQSLGSKPHGSFLCCSKENCFNFQTIFLVLVLIGSLQKRIIKNKIIR